MLQLNLREKQLVNQNLALLNKILDARQLEYGEEILRTLPEERNKREDLFNRSKAIDDLKVTFKKLSNQYINNDEVLSERI